MKLVFKLRLFVNRVIDSIDNCGTSRQIGDYHSNFKSLLCLQVEKYLSTEKWVLQEGEEDIEDKLLQLIGMALGVKFGGVNYLSEEVGVEECVRWAREVYGRLYFKKVGKEMADGTVKAYWRSAEQILRPDQTYDESYLELSRRLLGCYFGCELFEVRVDSNVGRDITLGINEVRGGSDEGKSLYLFRPYSSS